MSQNQSEVGKDRDHYMYFTDPDSEIQNKLSDLWKILYSVALFHNVDEISSGLQ